DRSKVQRPRPPGAVEDVVGLQVDVVEPGLPMPFRDLRPDGAGTEMEGSKWQGGLRQVRDAMRDGYVANEGQAVHDGRQQSQAEQCNPGGGAVVPSPAQDESQRENRDDGGVR